MSCELYYLYSRILTSYKSNMSKRATIQTTVVQTDGETMANGNLQHPSTTAKSSSDAWIIKAVQLAACVAGGLVFGFAAEKARGKFNMSFVQYIRA